MTGTADERKPFDLAGASADAVRRSWDAWSGGEAVGPALAGLLIGGLGGTAALGAAGALVGPGTALAAALAGAGAGFAGGAGGVVALRHGWTRLMERLDRVLGPNNENVPDWSDGALGPALARFRDRLLEKAEETAALKDPKTGFWLVRAPGDVEPRIMTAREFGDFREALSKTDTPLTMVRLDAETGRASLVRELRGERHCETGPAVVVYGDDGAVQSESHFFAGRKIPAEDWQKHLDDGFRRLLLAMNRDARADAERARRSGPGLGTVLVVGALMN